MKGGRARWHIENETFNTLKNQGYYFEHNFGHGQQHLSTVFAFFMLLAFLVDQLQGLGCKLFQPALTAMKSKVRFWERLRAYLFTFQLPHWQTLYLAIIKPPPLEIPRLNSSWSNFRGVSFRLSGKTLLGVGKPGLKCVMGDSLSGSFA
jgi:hypothetical protein